jgi:hypothetical protein
MYLCASEQLLLAGGRRVKRGDPVPEAEQWCPAVLRSNLRLGYIVRQEAKAPASSVVVDIGMHGPSAAPLGPDRGPAVLPDRKFKRR